MTRDKMEQRLKKEVERIYGSTDSECSGDCIEAVSFSIPDNFEDSQEPRKPLPLLPPPIPNKSDIQPGDTELSKRPQGTQGRGSASREKFRKVMYKRR